MMIPDHVVQADHDQAIRHVNAAIKPLSGPLHRVILLTSPSGPTCRTDLWIAVDQKRGRCPGQHSRQMNRRRGLTHPLVFAIVKIIDSCFI
jgi:hypothetical protein